MQKNKTKWIWLPEWSAEDKEKPVLALFLKKIVLKEEPESAELSISADTRYKLYINGRFVEMGPDRGDRQVWFYDKINLCRYLQKGETVICWMRMKAGCAV